MYRDTQAQRQVPAPKRVVPVTAAAEEEAQHLRGGTAARGSRTRCESPGHSLCPAKGGSSFTASENKLPEAGGKGPQCYREIELLLLGIRI